MQMGRLVCLNVSGMASFVEGISRRAQAPDLESYRKINSGDAQLLRILYREVMPRKKCKLPCRK